MENKEELEILKLGFTMQKALEEYLANIRAITLEAINKLELLLYMKKNPIEKDPEEERKKTWQIRESLDQWPTKE